MKAMAASRGAGLAEYNWKEAASLDFPDPWAAKTDLDRAIDEGAEYEELIDLAYQARLERVQAAMPPRDHHHILHGLSDVGIDHALLREKATGDVDTALARYDAVEARQVTGIEYRRDTSPELAELLGIDLDAPPDLQDLKNLLSAKRADGEQIEGRFYRTDRPEQMTMGSLELIFSADKSVSAVYALANPAEREAITNAQRMAVDKAMHQIADRAGFIRSRRGGVDKHDPADLTWVQWQHRLSRSGDPQLHTHVSIINVVRSRADGKVGTLDTQLLNGSYSKFRETYHRALAIELGKLGMAVEFDAKIPAARLTNVPQLVQQHFSTRSVQAQGAAAKWLQENTSVNFSDLTPKQRSQWLTQMVAKTRPPIGMYYVPGNGHAAWHARAAGQGYVPPAHFIDPKRLKEAGIVQATVGQSHSTGHSVGTVDPKTAQRAGIVHVTVHPRQTARYDEGVRWGRSL